MQNRDTLSSLADIGEGDIDDTLAHATRYALLLYGTKAKSSKSLDELRYILATTYDKPASGCPPTADAFKQHLRRVHYQVSIWKHSHVAKPEIGTPTQNGWTLTASGSLEPIMFELDAAPVESRDLTHLYYTRIEGPNTSILYKNRGT